MRRAPFFRPLLLALAGLALLAAPAAAAPAVSGEFKLATPIETNTKIAAGADGNIWVNLSGPEKDVARVTPSGQVTEFELGVAGTSGVASAAGKVWVTRANGVNSFEPANPEGTNSPFAIPGIEGNSPIVLGPDGNLWVATKDKVFRVPPSNPAGATPFTFSGLGPTDIDATNTHLVIADAGNVKRILAVSTSGAPLGELPVGGPPQGVAGNPNGDVAFTQPVNEPKEMGLISPTGVLFVKPIPGEDPFGIALGADGAYWSAERNSNGLLRMSPDGAITKLTGFSAGSEPRQIAAGPANTLWVTLPGNGVNSVGRVSGVDPISPPPSPPPPTAKAKARLQKGPKGKVTTRSKRARVAFRFRSADATATFQCRLFGLPPKGATKKGGKQAGSSAAKIKVPAFKGCKSPKRYRLKPGRYRFQVRAVNAAGAGVPAKRTFRVVRVAG